MWESVNLNLVKLAVNAIPTGLFICDAQGIIRFINHAYADYLSTTQEHALGRHITELISDSGIPRVISTGQPELGTWRSFKHSGKKQQILVNRVPIKDENGHIVGAFSLTLLDTPEQMNQILHDLEEMHSKVNTYAKKIKTALASNYTLDSILGISPQIQHLKTLLTRYARTDSPVLILGATGTGKELAAGAIHATSPRANGPFVSLNCAAIPKELFESEMFGYAPGAFSGAHKDGKIGMVELADQGTLFLDEIGDMPLHAQVKLLRLLEEKQITKLGGTQPKITDFRLVSATNRDLPAMIQAGVFREDLYYRINPMTLHLPKLQDRKEDIMPLVHDILAHMSAIQIRCTESVIDTLHNYTWPGNVRELRNVIIRALSLCQNNTITINDLPQELLQPTFIQHPNPSSTLQAGLNTHQAQLILATLCDENWNISKSARRLGISRANLYEKLKKYNIKRDKL